MGIAEAFDTTLPLFNPEDFYGKHDKIADVCVLSFSKSVADKVLDNFETEIVAKSGTANGDIRIYRLKESGVLFYLSPIGSAVAGTVLQEVHTLTGADKYVAFGSCGILDQRCKDKIIVPCKAYRDEGFSYHYAPASDYIDVKNAEYVNCVLQNAGASTIVGKTWTTDAIYRETTGKIQKRKEDGCVCVEMECAGLQAVCDYLSAQFYTFFFSGDLLLDKWERGHLGNESEKEKQKSCLQLALAIAESLK